MAEKYRMLIERRNNCIIIQSNIQKGFRFTQSYFPANIFRKNIKNSCLIYSESIFITKLEYVFIFFFLSFSLSTISTYIQINSFDHF